MFDAWIDFEQSVDAGDSRFIRSASRKRPKRAGASLRFQALNQIERAGPTRWSLSRQPDADVDQCLSRLDFVRQFLRGGGHPGNDGIERLLAIRFRSEFRKPHRSVERVRLCACRRPRHRQERGFLNVLHPLSERVRSEQARRIEWSLEKSYRVDDRCAIERRGQLSEKSGAIPGRAVGDRLHRVVNDDAARFAAPDPGGELDQDLGTVTGPGPPQGERHGGDEPSLLSGEKLEQFVGDPMSD